MRSIFILISLLIVYGSLFPFNFDGDAFTSTALKTLMNSWGAPSSRGDLLGNIILFIPFGFVGMLVFTRERSMTIALILLPSLGIMLAVGCQIAQISVPSRSPVMIDVIWNAVGFVMGVFAAGSQRMRDFFEGQTIEQSKIVPILLLGLWLTSRLIPFVPTIDWQAYKLALKPLLLAPKFEWSAVGLITGAWMACAHFGTQILKQHWRTVYLSIMIIIVLLLQIVIVTQSVSAGDVIAALMAIVLWSVVINKFPQRPLLIATLLLVGLVINGLMPFSLSYTSESFIWLPFGGNLTGSMITNAISLTQKLFLFGAIFWLCREARWRVVPTTILLAITIVLIEIAQIWLEGHTAEITDVLLVIAFGIAWLRFADDLPEQDFEPFPAHSQKMAEAETIHKAQKINYSEAIQLPFLQKQLLMMLGGGFIVMVLVVYFALRLPGVPYNVRELYIHGGSLLDLVFFFLAVIGFGGGAAWVGNRVAYSSKPYITAPLQSFAVAIAIYLLLWLCVTDESIADIAGSSVFVHRVSERAVLGQLGVDFVSFVGAANMKAVTEIFEPAIRFAVLIEPIIFMLVGIFAVFFGQALTSKTVTNSWADWIGRFALIMLYFLPWFILCKVIAFDWSSTDNLNELVARDEKFGLGGGGYLYALVLLITACGATLAWAIAQRKLKQIVIVLLSSLALLPVGWWLLNAGLVSDFTKYGMTYSGVDFLLGPDRKTHLADTELFARWIVLQLSAVSALAFGSFVYLRINTTGMLSKKVVDVEKKQWLEVRFDEEQFAFIETLAERFDSSIDEVIDSVVDDFQLLLKRKPDAKLWLKQRFQAPPSTARLGKKMLRCQVGLVAEHKYFVDAIAKDANTTPSRAIRILVDIYIENYQSR